MKKFLLLCTLISGIVSAKAQTVIDNFIVGPYIVDYKGQGDVKYRLRDDINLYEFFELRKDTTIVTAAPVEVVTPVEHAIVLSGFLGANRFATDEMGISGLWKQNIGTNLYFNGGLSLTIVHSNYVQVKQRNMLEIGVPLQIELGKLNHRKSSLYGSIGLTPSYYSTLNAKIWDGTRFVDAAKDWKTSGLLIAPTIDFGGNIPVGGTILRIGVYGTYKINCTPGTYDAYKNCAGRFFLGAKIGVVL